MALAFDTLAQAKRLREVGFDEKQAEALTTALRDATAPFDVSTLATKADLDALKAATRADLDALNVATRADVNVLKADVAALKADTKDDLRALKADILLATKAELAAGLATLKADLLQWMIGRLVIGAFVFNAFVAVGGMLAIAKLLGH
jgi:hypothetical protein